MNRTTRRKILRLRSNDCFSIGERRGGGEIRDGRRYYDIMFGADDHRRSSVLVLVPRHCHALSSVWRVAACTVLFLAGDDR
jgi:hypothetical protein